MAFEQGEKHKIFVSLEKNSGVRKQLTKVKNEIVTNDKEVLKETVQSYKILQEITDEDIRTRTYMNGVKITKLRCLNWMHFAIDHDVLLH